MNKEQQEEMLSATKRKRRPQTKEERNIDINWTDIIYDSTCISLKLPIIMSCDNWKGKMEAMCVMIKKAVGLQRDFVTFCNVGIANNYGWQNMEKIIAILLLFKSMSVSETT